MRVAAVLFFCLSASPLLAAEVQGLPRIVDADTVYVGATKVRLNGVDAPETDQICLNSEGRDIACGIEAKNQLLKYSSDRPWRCTLTGSDRYGRSLGTCFVNGDDVSKWLVRNGWALAFRRYSTAYISDEDDARQRKVGLWSGAFIAPWDWRHRSVKTVVLGSLEVPTDAQRKLVAPLVSGSSPAPDCVIKGNLRRDQCIYHIPGGRFYERLQMQRSASRRWFCSEAEAEAAGCRKSKQ